MTDWLLGPCPECGADWTGAPIKEEYRQEGMYGPPETAPTHYSRLIGIELPYDDPNHYDGISFWLCPDCGAKWNRFTGEIAKPNIRGGLRARLRRKRK